MVVLMSALIVGVCFFAYKLSANYFHSVDDVSVVDSAPTASVQAIQNEVTQEEVYTAFDKLANFEGINAPRVINALTVSDVVPETGKLIVADLKNKLMQLYEDGEQVAEYHITSFGRPGTPWETPAGLYSIHTKEPVHFSTIANVYMPFSMQFYGNYFIHGRTYYPDGSLTSATFSGGCIKLATDDAEKVFDFADIGTTVFVYDPKEKEVVPSLAFKNSSVPDVTAEGYLVADLETGDVLFEQRAQEKYPLASLTKLMTAIVANETINFTRHVMINDTEIGATDASGKNKFFVVEELMSPLLMSSNTAVAEALEAYIGRKNFVRWMNNAARAYNMNDTTFVDATGASTQNTATPDDLFRLSWYIKNKKSFIFDVTQGTLEKISATDSTAYTIESTNTPVDTEPFSGGMVSSISSTSTSVVAVLTVPVEETERSLAVILMDSKDHEADTQKLAQWVSSGMILSPQVESSACLSCAPMYRKIELP